MARHDWRAGKWATHHATGAPLPADSVEKLEIEATQKSRALLIESSMQPGHSRRCLHEVLCFDGAPRAYPFSLSAIADQALAQSEGSGQRFYSMSSQIRKGRSDYGADAASMNVLRKADFWQHHARVAFSESQKVVLNRYLDGFEGNLTAKKWAALSKVSIPTAQRDINELVERGVMKRNAGGSKNTSYEVVVGG